MKVLLLDLDGTLTEARKPIGGEDLGKIRAVFSYLSRQYEIGVVTGSPLPFMLEQIGPLWGSGVISKWMPCNGTQMYVDGDREVRHRVEMREEVGGSYEKIVREIFDYQSEILRSEHKIPISGSFLTYRGSMLNWSPSGRDGSDQDRAAFVELDQATGLRLRFLERLNEFANSLPGPPVVATLGGQTSFDIYPKGWDKTYCLRHYSDSAEFFFIGDATHPGGNDYSISTHPGVRSWTTSGPRDTLRILKSLP